MKKNPEFDTIRPFYDDEISVVVEQLLADEEFKRVVDLVLPDIKWTELSALMRSFQSKYDFQHKLIKRIVYKLIAKSTQDVECTGFEKLDKSGAHLFISNHRDIVLDAAILSVLLSDNGYDTPEIAIGDNLLLHPWIERIVRLNKSFIVKRSVPMRQMLETSKQLSRYIHYTINEKVQSIWIAQREGRAKDSDDRTQDSLLKMLAMGGEGNFLENVRNLNICPLSLSYEYDPCDYLKAKEYQLKRDNPEYKKSREDDLLSMETGIFGTKGNVHFQFGNPINTFLETEDPLEEKAERIRRVAFLIDREIFLNYRFYPVNYIAYDRLQGSTLFKDKYTEEDVRSFDIYLREQLDKIDLPQRDIPFLTGKILEMYSNPVKNYLSVANQ